MNIKHANKPIDLLEQAASLAQQAQALRQEIEKAQQTPTPAATPSARLLRHAFVGLLFEQLGAETMAQIMVRNARYRANGETHYCASHEFCDANVTMAEAFEMIVGREMNFESEDDLALWNGAWAEALEPADQASRLMALCPPLRRPPLPEDQERRERRYGAHLALTWAATELRQLSTTGLGPLTQHDCADYLEWHATFKKLLAKEPGLRSLPEDKQ